MDHDLTVAFASHNAAAAAEFDSQVCRQFPELNVKKLDLGKSTEQPTGSSVVLLFDSRFEEDADRMRWLSDWNDVRATTPLLPVALDADRGRPPDPISTLKSRFWSTDRDEIQTSIGASMGLALRRGENRIFVSYRATDGRQSAENLEGAFVEAGYATWRDESNNVYDDPHLQLGDDVQQEIADNLSGASALVLVDTPDSISSPWVRLEVELAVGKMIPIFPVVLHPPSEETSTCRFRILQSLHRRAVVRAEFSGAQLVLPDDELAGIVQQVEGYLQSVYVNRVVHLRELERFLTEKNWTFGRNRHMPHLYDGRTGDVASLLTLLACCSFEDQVFTPRLRTFIDGIKELAARSELFTCNFYLYPGASLHDADLRELVRNEAPGLQNANASLISYNEAAARIAAISGGFGV